jgi:type I phosphodiesterase/nucleotide pyrophosphatase
VIESGQDRRVDELRQQLRTLGYLDAGVNRFVLGSATDTRRPFAIALLASLRVGCLAALLLGPAAAIGLNSRLPGLVTGPRDAIVVAAYLGLLFGAGVSLIAFLASLLVASLAGEGIARRARPLSRVAGALVAVACLAYLTLWWRSANAGFGWTAPIWTGFALAVAVAISLLLGHVVTVAAFAVIIARRGHSAASDLRFTTSSSTWRMTLVAALIAFAGAAALLVVTAPGSPGVRPPAPLAVVSSGLRVRLIAIDGVDPGVLDELAGTGRIPRVAAALTGTRARLSLQDTDTTRDPARGWTTIATGRAPEEHGVRGLETRRVAGLQGTVVAGERSPLGRAIRTATDLLRLTRPAIASGNERRVKTMWDVASDAGLRTAVVNWWATWPASLDAGSGIVVSDRATLRLERGGALDAEIAPASLFDPLHARWPAIRSGAAGHARAAAASLAWGDSDTRAALERSAELDAIQLALTREVSTPRPDLSAVYLPGLDIAQNTLLGRRDTALAPSVVAARLQALRDYYIFLDRLLADVLSPADDELVVVVTEPGRVTAATDALMGVMGRIAAPKRELAGNVTDVAPTLLHALGVPISRELSGAALTGLFEDGFARRYPVRQVETYGRPLPNTSARSGQPLDQEMIDRLRSLGYVK